jgi:hypothetical protein
MIPDADVTSEWVLVEFHGSAAARSVVAWLGVFDLTADEVSGLHRRMVRTDFRFYPASWGLT